MKKLPKRKIYRYCLADIAKGLFHGIFSDSNAVLYHHAFKSTGITVATKTFIEEILRDYCEPTDFENRPYKVLEEVLNENFPDVIVSPFLLTAGTDARHFTGIADSISRFAPIDLDKAQFASIHGANEHIKIKNVNSFRVLEASNIIIQKKFYKSTS